MGSGDSAENHHGDEESEAEPQRFQQEFCRGSGKCPVCGSSELKVAAPLPMNTSKNVPSASASNRTAMVEVLRVDMSLLRYPDLRLPPI